MESAHILYLFLECHLIIPCWDAKSPSEKDRISSSFQKNKANAQDLI